MKLGGQRTGLPSQLQQIAKTFPGYPEHLGDLALAAQLGVVGLEHPFPQVYR